MQRANISGSMINSVWSRSRSGLRIANRSRGNDSSGGAQSYAIGQQGSQFIFGLLPLLFTLCSAPRCIAVVFRVQFLSSHVDS